MTRPEVERVRPPPFAPARTRFDCWPPRHTACCSSSARANVLAAMAWWAAWLVAARWHGITTATATVTRWMDARGDHAVPGAAVVHLRLSAHRLSAVARPSSARCAALSTCRCRPAGWTVAHAGGARRASGSADGRRCAHDRRLECRHVLAGARASQWQTLQLACRERTFALCFGIAGLVLLRDAAAWNRGAVANAALKLGIIGTLVPIYFTVCHRMIPFFTANNRLRLSGGSSRLDARLALGTRCVTHLGLELHARICMELGGRHTARDACSRDC